MRKEKILIWSVLCFLLAVNCRAQNEIDKFMKKSETLNIQYSGKYYSYYALIKQFNHNTILIADIEKGTIITYSLKGEIKNKYNLTEFPHRICDAALDEKGTLYILDNRDEYVFIMNDKGGIKKKIKVERGEEILVEKIFYTCIASLFLVIPKTNRYFTSTTLMVNCLKVLDRHQGMLRKKQLDLSAAVWH